MTKIFISILLFSSLSLTAQQDKVGILKPIKSMFDGMRAGDSLKVRTSFVSDAAMHSTYINKEGKKQFRKGSLEQFLTAVGTPHDDTWDEQIFSYKIEQDGTLASVWTEYTFYLGAKMSHCGVNAFQLVDTEKGWKILNITDTRRTENCKLKDSTN